MPLLKVWNGTTWVASGATPGTAPVGFVASFSDSGVLAIGTGLLRWYNDSGNALTISAVRASVGTAPTGASIIVDVNINGSTIYSTQANRPSISAGSTTGTGGTRSTSILSNGSYLTADIDQVGSVVSGNDLVVSIWMS